MAQDSQQTSHPKTVLLIGLLPTVVDQARGETDRESVRFVTATNQAQVEAVFDAEHIDAAILGAGIDLEQRLAIVRAIFERSDTTTVHMKDKMSGPQGFGPFVDAVLRAISNRSNPH